MGWKGGDKKLINLILINFIITKGTAKIEGLHSEENNVIDRTSAA